MSAHTPDSNPHHDLAGDLEIAQATERLFAEIATTSGNPALQAGLASVNAQLQSIRPFEAALFPDRQAELDALTKAWREGDMARLQILLRHYFARRRDAAPQLAHLISQRH